MMKLSQALTAIIFGTYIPTIYSHGISGNLFGAYPSTTRSLSETDFFQSRRRAELTLSQECIDGSKQIQYEDIGYNTTFAPIASSCPIRNTNQDGTVTFVADRRDCDDSEFLAFCDANYQSLKLPNVKVSCEPNLEDLNPAPQLIYTIDYVECVDPSCPSEVSPEDVMEFLFLTSGNFTLCTAEFVEEGETPQIELPDAIVPDNLSEECIDQIDALRTLFNADEEWVNITSTAPECRNVPKSQWIPGNDTFIVFDDEVICDEGKEYYAKRKAYCEAHPNYQFLDFGTVKATCPGLSGDGAGTLTVFYTQWTECKGLSCPANPADWSIPDLKYTAEPGTLETSCEWEFLEVEDIPEPPETAAPATEDDATAAPEDETGGVDATAAPEDEDSASVDDESSASRFVAGMTIALPLAAAFRLLV